AAVVESPDPARDDVRAADVAPRRRLVDVGPVRIAVHGPRTELRTSEIRAEADLRAVGLVAHRRTGWQLGVVPMEILGVDPIGARVADPAAIARCATAVVVATTDVGERT